MNTERPSSEVTVDDLALVRWDGCLEMAGDSLGENLRLLIV
jgi:hypothetical protein